MTVYAVDIVVQLPPKTVINVRVIFLPEVLKILIC